MGGWCRAKLASFGQNQVWEQRQEWDERKMAPLLESRPLWGQGSRKPTGTFFASPKKTWASFVLISSTEEQSVPLGCMNIWVCTSRGSVVGKGRQWPLTLHNGGCPGSTALGDLVSVELGCICSHCTQPVLPEAGMMNGDPSGQHRMSEPSRVW